MKLKNCKIMQKVIVKKHDHLLYPGAFESKVFKYGDGHRAIYAKDASKTVGMTGEIRIVSDRGLVLVWFEKLKSWFHYSPEMLKKK